jgi:hypothetical protein
MFTIKRAAAGAAALIAGVSGTLVLATGPADASSPRTAPTIRPCGAGDVSFYYGGYDQGVSQVQFQLTLLAHDGVVCTLSDTPLISLSGPPGQKRIPLEINGRGGTLTLDARSPLHATIYCAVPDTEQSFTVDDLILSMPDHTSRSVFFEVPGGATVSTQGVSVSSWTTGAGLGLGEQPLGS